MRLHVFEFEDQAWFPCVIRNAMMDYLQFVFDKINIYKPATGILSKMMDKLKGNQIMDLCSGSGGDMVQLHKQLETNTNQEIHISLSDRFPNTEAYKEIEHNSNGHITYIGTSLEATDYVSEHESIRTIFSAFHHFKPEYAQKVIENAIQSNAPIAIFDGGTKHLLFFLSMLIVHPLALFIVTPFIGHFSLSRLFFTYIIPLIPLCTMWDGSVSILRLYTTKEMEKIIYKAGIGNYYWEVGSKKTCFGLKMNYMIGIPNAGNSDKI